MLFGKGGTFLAIGFVIASAYADTEREVVSVDTNVGRINGYVKDTTYLGEKYLIDRFQGIPFAEAPIADRRFMKALPKAKFNEAFNAFTHSSMCMQSHVFEAYFPDIDYVYSEDCLYLNIYAPHSRNTDEEKLPVLIWIYGGGFNFGFSDIYLGDNIAAYGDVIVVTINYRLSLWGFLNAGNEDAPGNAGLWDQHLAIKWVHDNIEAFGGDNQRISLFGESAGSASVIYQALYPGNKGLFQRVIGQSGSAASYWASRDDGNKFVNRLASYTDCNNDDSQVVVSCLQKVSNERFTELVSNFSYGFFEFPFPFNPSRDEDFIRYDPKSPFDTAPSEVIDMFQSVDIMSGVNTAEGSIGLSPFLGVSDPETFEPNRDEFINTFVPGILSFVYPDCENKQVLEDLLLAEYTNWNNPDDPINIRKEFVNMHGDAGFTGPLYSTLTKHVQVSRANTFMYLFDIVPTTTLFFKNSWISGLPHAEEIPNVFGYKWHKDNGETFGEEAWETTLSKYVITMWTNFAKTGNPNEPVKVGLDWLPFTEKHHHYLRISRDMTPFNVKQRWHTRRAQLWSEVLPKMANGGICSATNKATDKEMDGTCERDGGCNP